MTLLIPLLLRLTTLFERGERVNVVLPEPHDVSEETAPTIAEKEWKNDR